MAGFLYYIPAATSPKKVFTEADLVEVGLGFAVGGGGVSCVGHANGPDGGAGVIVAFNGDKIEPRYKADAQEWRKGGGGKWWVGIDRAAQPGEADLRRGRMYEGTAVKLRDGNEWVIPRCFGYLESRPATLPRVLDVAEDGEAFRARIDPAFAQLCEGAMAYFREWMGVGPAATETDEVRAKRRVELAVAAMGVNYRVGKVEAVGLLSLLGTEELAAVLRATIDADEIEGYLRSQKKTGSAGDGSNTSSGGTDGAAAVVGADVGAAGSD